MRTLLYTIAKMQKQEKKIKNAQTHGRGAVACAKRKREKIIGNVDYGPAVTCEYTWASVNSRKQTSMMITMSTVSFTCSA